MTKNSVNLKYYLVLMGMLIFKHSVQSVERHQSILSRVLNMDDIISNNFCKLNKQEQIIMHFSMNLLTS